MARTAVGAGAGAGLGTDTEIGVVPWLRDGHEDDLEAAMSSGAQHPNRSHRNAAAGGLPRRIVAHTPRGGRHGPHGAGRSGRSILPMHNGGEGTDQGLGQRATIERAEAEACGSSVRRRGARASGCHEEEAEPEPEPETYAEEDGQEHDEESKDDVDPDFFDKDIADMKANAVKAVQAVGSGITAVKDAWVENRVGERAVNLGWNALRSTVGQGWSTITDAADFWIRDAYEGAPDLEEDMQPDIDADDTHTQPSAGTRTGCI